MSQTRTPASTPPGRMDRLQALGVFRVLIMWLMASAGLKRPKVSEAFTDSALSTETYGIVVERSVFLGTLWLSCLWLHRSHFLIRV